MVQDLQITEEDELARETSVNNLVPEEEAEVFLFDSHLVESVDVEKVASFKSKITASKPGEHLVMRSLGTGDYKRSESIISCHFCHVFFQFQSLQFWEQVFPQTHLQKKICSNTQFISMTIFFLLDFDGLLGQLTTFVPLPRSQFISKSYLTSAVWGFFLIKIFSPPF